jgi:hypothetical protein
MDEEDVIKMPERKYPDIRSLIGVNDTSLFRKRVNFEIVDEGVGLNIAKKRFERSLSIIQKIKSSNRNIEPDTDTSRFSIRLTPTLRKRIRPEILNSLFVDYDKNKDKDPRLAVEISLDPKNNSLSFSGNVEGVRTVLYPQEESCAYIASMQKLDSDNEWVTTEELDGTQAVYTIIFAAEDLLAGSIRNARTT